MTTAPNKCASSQGPARTHELLFVLYRVERYRIGRGIAIKLQRQEEISFANAARKISTVGGSLKDRRSREPANHAEIHRCQSANAGPGRWSDLALRTARKCICGRASQKLPLGRESLAPFQESNITLGFSCGAWRISEGPVILLSRARESRDDVVRGAKR